MLNSPPPLPPQKKPKKNQNTPKIFQLNTHTTQTIVYKHKTRNTVKSQLQRARFIRIFVVEDKTEFWKDDT